MVLVEEEYFNMLSFVLVPTHKSINSMNTYACIGLWYMWGVCKERGGGLRGSWMIKHLKQHDANIFYL